MNNNILIINNISKNYHNQKEEITAIKDLTLEVKDGEFIAIVGPSGCGKSSLLSILCGLEKNQMEISFSQIPIKAKLVICSNKILFSLG